MESSRIRIRRQGKAGIMGIMRHRDGKPQASTLTMILSYVLALEKGYHKRTAQNVV